MIPHEEWKWYGMPLHFVCANKCRWHKATLIGEYVISSVGDMKHPVEPRWGNEIGHNRTYEIMVFRVNGTKKDCDCPEIMPIELICWGCNDHNEADRLHDKACLMAAKGEIPDDE